MSNRLWRANSPYAAVSQGVAVNVIALLATVVGGIVTARSLGPDGRGQAAALIALPTFVSFVATAGLPSALVYEIRRESALAAALVTAALLLVSGIGVLAAGLAWWVTPEVLWKMSPELVETAQLYTAFILAGLLSNVGIAALQAHGEFATCNALRLAQPLLQLAGVGLLWLVGSLNATSVALLTLASGVPGVLWNLRWIARQGVPRFARMREALGRLSGYAARAASGELLAGLAGQVDKVVLVTLFSPALLGLYVVAMSLSRVLAVIPTAVVPVLFPNTAGRPAAEVAAVTSRAAAMTGLCVGGGSLLLGATGPWLLTLFYGADFRAAAWGFRILLLEAALSAVAQVLAQAYLALNRPALFGVQQGVGVIVGVGLLYLLAPGFGIEGAALALLAASIARLLMIYGSFATVLGLGPPRLIAELGPGLATIRAKFKADRNGHSPRLSDL